MARMCGNSDTARLRGAFIAEVLANEPLCRDHWRMVLTLPQFPTTRAGQFVNLQCRPLDDLLGARQVDWPAGGTPRFTQPELTDRETMLRRPFSLAGRRDCDGKVELDVIYRTVGVGTHWMSELKPASSISILGPLGNGFRILPGKPSAVLVGGGVGIPPMLYLAEALTAGGKNIAAFLGARSAELFPLHLLTGGHVSPEGSPAECVAELAEWSVPTAVATDDGSLGFTGLVSEPFERWLDAGKLGADDVVVYSCGPEPMMQAVGDICIERGIECFLAMERHMACGMGTCQSCIVKIRDDSEQGWSFKLCCTDGPVFSAGDVIW